VDDDDNSRELVRQILADAGYHVELAVDGVDALEHLNAVDIDIAIIDLDMPRMGGIALCERIREQRHLSDVRILILSAVDLLSEQLRALRAGAHDFLPKPVDERELMRKLRTFDALISMNRQVARLGKR
jgi:DNA-binding response OmpR family regulator